MSPGTWNVVLAAFASSVGGAVVIAVLIYCGERLSRREAERVKADDAARPYRIYGGLWTAQIAIANARAAARAMDEELEASCNSDLMAIEEMCALAAQAIGNIAQEHGWPHIHVPPTYCWGNATATGTPEDHGDSTGEGQEWGAVPHYPLHYWE